MLWLTMDAAFGPDDPLQHDIAGTLGNGSWGYIVGTYDKDAGPDNQRLYLNGTCVAQMAETGRRCCGGG
jgi:hypothetical protein